MSTSNKKISDSVVMLESMPKHIKQDRPGGGGEVGERTPHENDCRLRSTPHQYHTCIFFTCVRSVLLVACFRMSLGARDVQSACLARITESRETSMQ